MALNFLNMAEIWPLVQFYVKIFHKGKKNISLKALVENQFHKINCIDVKYHLDQIFMVSKMIVEFSC